MLHVKCLLTYLLTYLLCQHELKRRVGQLVTPPSESQSPRIVNVRSPESIQKSEAYIARGGGGRPGRYTLGAPKMEKKKREKGRKEEKGKQNKRKQKKI